MSVGRAAHAPRGAARRSDDGQKTVRATRQSRPRPLYGPAHDGTFPSWRSAHRAPAFPSACRPPVRGRTPCCSRRSWSAPSCWRRCSRMSRTTPRARIGRQRSARFRTTPPSRRGARGRRDGGPSVDARQRARARCSCARGLALRAATRAFRSRVERGQRVALHESGRRLRSILLHARLPRRRAGD